MPKVIPWKQDFQTGFWTWNLYDLKRRKAVYWYGEATIAQGTYLLVFIQLTNGSSGHAFPKDIASFYITDSRGNRHYLSEPLSLEREASIAAGWQFQTDILWRRWDPGKVIGAVEAWDLPGGSGELYLTIGSTTIYLGNFDEMPVEDQQ